MSKNFSSDQQLDCTQPDSTDSSELCQLKQDIMECVRRDGFQKETDALLRMLEKPRQETEVDLILREINTPQPSQEETPPPTRDGEQAVSSGRPSGHLAIAVMLFVFSVLLRSSAVVISLGAGGKENQTIPSEPASLCDTGSEGGYMLGIDGETLAVYYNGVLQRSIAYPVNQLSEYDRELLVAGIPLSDENALRQAIEDYTS